VTLQREKKKSPYGKCRGSQEEKQGKREPVWEAVWVRVQASLFEIEIGRRDPPMEGPRKTNGVVGRLKLWNKVHISARKVAFLNLRKVIIENHTFRFFNSIAGEGSGKLYSSFGSRAIPDLDR
jgi:hypothetical protein